ncbi:MAG: hypothetical protein K9N10_22860 [Deltaproteobacteria bacterium]|nr:hypothetical protein [Deltaproteobacteria bacterium]
MKAQTKMFIEMAINSDSTVSGEHRDRILKAVNAIPSLPDKVFLNQRETAYVLSVTRQTVGNMVKNRRLKPVDITGTGLMRYPMEQIRKLADKRTAD